MFNTRQIARAIHFSEPAIRQWLCKAPNIAVGNKAVADQNKRNGSASKDDTTKADVHGWAKAVHRLNSANSPPRFRNPTTTATAHGGERPSTLKLDSSKRCPRTPVGTVTKLHISLIEL